MKRMLTDRRVMLAGIGGVMTGTLLANKALAGSLEPPGPPGPTGRTTDQLASMIARPSGVSEPRTPVTGLPGSASARYLISESGSYCVTENLIGVSGMNGIEIAADNVDLDVQGFHLIGGGGTPGDVSAAIVCHGQNNCVYNGTTEGWGVGVNAAAATRFLLWDVTAIGAAMIGFTLGFDGQAYDCDVYSCLVGFDAPGQRTIIEECGAWSCPTGFQCTGTQNLIIANCATASATAPFSIGQGNSYGPIVVVTGMGNIGGLAGSGHVLANLVY